MQENIERLQHLLAEVYVLPFGKKRKYFHLRTIDNLVNYISDIEGAENQLAVYEKLFDYLSLIKTIDDFEQVDIYYSRDLFDEFIHPLVKKYDPHLGFWPYAPVFYIILFGLMASSILIFFFRPIWVFSIVGGLGMLYYIWLWTRKRKKKVYGFLY